ncbi:hypothetical protein H4R20_002867, partial [Coemansia guatemalensis]
MGSVVYNAEERLKISCSILIPNEYHTYIQAHANEWQLLDWFYNETTMTHAHSTHQIHKNYVPVNPKWSKRKARKMKPFAGRVPESHPLHQKLRLAAYWNNRQADDRLARNLHEKFGKDAVLVIGNWSANMARYHEPIRGKGWRDMLKRHGFTVYLLDEYRTSSICPVCESSLENFQWVCNPRPYQCNKSPSVKCHGLLRCQNENCLKSVAKYEETTRLRKWNRDTAAVLNFRHILHGLRENGCVPERFQRAQQPKKPDDEPKRKRKPATSKKAIPNKRPAPCDSERPLIELLQNA